MPTSGADFQPRYAATQADLSDLTNIKQSTPGPFQAARAGIAQNHIRQTDVGVDSVTQSTHLQSVVTDWSRVRTAQTSMAPHRNTEKGFQTLSTSTAAVVASSSLTPSQRSTWSMRPPRVHRDLPHRSAFPATAFLTGRQGKDEAKRQSITTTTCGNVMSHVNV